MAVSEREAWRIVQRDARALAQSTNMPARARRLEKLAATMLAQLDRGVHANPPIVTYFNPPRGGELMSRRVYAVEYKHAGDGQDYRHDFKGGVEMYAARGGPGSILLWRPDGKPLSREFDV